jgi:hypothetical protein
MWNNHSIDVASGIGICWNPLAFFSFEIGNGASIFENIPHVTVVCVIVVPWESLRSALRFHLTICTTLRKLKYLIINIMSCWCFSCGPNVDSGLIFLDFVNTFANISTFELNDNFIDILVCNLSTVLVLVYNI